MSIRGAITIFLLIISTAVAAQVDTIQHRHHVLFGFDHYHLTNEEAGRLNDFLNTLSPIDSVKISLSAHTDSIGSFDYNERLSQNRLHTVQKKLNEAGFSHIVSATAHGERQPIANNNSEESRQRNRRVEILAIEYVQEEEQEQKEVPVGYIVSGKVYDAQTREVIEAEIEVQFLRADSATAEYPSGWQGYAFNLKQPVAMRITAYAKGYVYQTKTLLRNEVLPQTEVDFYLEKLEVGKEFVAENIYFFPDQPVVVPSSWPQLRKLYKLMAENPTLVIEIQGHVNWPTTYPFSIDRQTRQLSHDRALTVYKYLVEKGIEENRMTYVGKSNTEMVYPDATTIEEYRQNMRVEIKIISY